MACRPVARRGAAPQHAANFLLWNEVWTSAGRKIYLDKLSKEEYKVFNSSLGGTMRFGHSAEAAIRAALYLASRPPGELSSIKDIAASTKLSKPYLSKVIQQLAREGLVRTFRGPGGGIELRKPPEAITLWSLVRATEGPGDPDRCALGIGNCSPKAPCPLHERWMPLRDGFQRLLEGTTLAGLLRDISQTQSDERSTDRPHARRGHRSALKATHFERLGRS